MPAKKKPKIQLYWSLSRSREPEVRWRLVAANGEIVLPPEGHRDETDALRAINRAKELLAMVGDPSALKVDLPGRKPEPGSEAFADLLHDAAREQPGVL